MEGPAFVQEAEESPMVRFEVLPHPGARAGRDLERRIRSFVPNPEASGQFDLRRRVVRGYLIGGGAAGSAQLGRCRLRIIVVEPSPDRLLANCREVGQTHPIC